MSGPGAVASSCRSPQCPCSNEAAMKVLVTGNEGYIGARLVPFLHGRGIEVVGLDTGYYRDGWLYSDNHQMPVLARTICKDLRQLVPADLAGIDAVVHLAELS